MGFTKLRKFPYNLGMKRQYLHTQFLFTSALLLCSCAFAQTAQKTQATPSVIASEFNSAIEAKNNAYNMAQDFFSAYSSTQKLYTDYKKQLCEFEKSLKSFNCNLENTQANLQAHKKALGEFADKLKSVANIYDFSKDAIQSAKEKIAESEKVVMAAPGENFQNKKQFEIVKANFNAAVSRLNNAQKCAVSYMLTAPMGAVATDGAASSLASAKSYAKKAQSAMEGQSEKFDEMKKSFDGAKAALKTLQKSYIALSEKEAYARAQTLAAFTEFTKAYINNPSNFQDCDTNLNFSPADFATCTESDSIALDTATAKNRYLAKSANSQLPMSASYRGAKFESESAANNTGKIIQAFAQIEYATRVLSKAADTANAICFAYESERQQAENEAQNAENLLVKGISLFSQSQFFLGNMKMLDMRIKQLAEKEKFVKGEFEKLAKQSEATFDNSLNLAKQIK